MSDNKGKKSKEVFRLTHSNPTIKGDTIVVMFEILYCDETGRPQRNVKIDFYDDYPRKIKATRTTNANGKAYFRYTKDDLDYIGTEKTIRAQIRGTGTETQDTVELTPDYGEGFVKRMRFARRNMAKHSSRMLKHFMVSTLLFLPAIISLIMIPQTVGVAMGLMFGALIYFFNKGKGKSTGWFISAWTFSIASGFVCSFLPMNILYFSIMYSYIVGTFFYVAEEVTYEIVYKKEGNQVSITWEKWINFYPTWAVIIAAIAIGMNFLSFCGGPIKLVIGIFELNSNVSSHFSQMPYDGEVLKQVGGNTSAITLMVKGMFKDVLDIFGWLVSIIILGLRASPGEFLDAIRGKSGETSTLRTLERVLFLKEIMDFFRNRGKIWKKD